MFTSPSAGEDAAFLRGGEYPDDSVALRAGIVPPPALTCPCVDGRAALWAPLLAALWLPLLGCDSGRAPSLRVVSVFLCAWSPIFVLLAELQLRHGRRHSHGAEETPRRPRGSVGVFTSPSTRNWATRTGMSKPKPGVASAHASSTPSTTS